MTGDELYVRATITSSKAPENPTSESPLKKAWTQPVGCLHGLLNERKMPPVRKRNSPTYEILHMNWQLSQRLPSHWIKTSLALIALAMPAIAQQTATNDQNVAAASR